MKPAKWFSWFRFFSQINTSTILNTMGGRVSVHRVFSCFGGDECDSMQVLDDTSHSEPIREVSTPPTPRISECDRTSEYVVFLQNEIRRLKTELELQQQKDNNNRRNYLHVKWNPFMTTDASSCTHSREPSVKLLENEAESESENQNTSENVDTQACITIQKCEKALPADFVVNINTESDAEFDWECV